MTAPQIKGWCPGALRPMESGDGWVVRIRPPLGRFSVQQAQALACLAKSYGNGLLDISNRANVQLRGVRKDSHKMLIAGLRDLGLVDSDTEAESRRNIILSPFGDRQADHLARQLTQALVDWTGPVVPGKFGFAIDTGSGPILGQAPADVRLERGADGGLLVCADGHALGQPVTEADAVDAMVALATAALANGPSGRMKTLVMDGFCVPTQFDTPRQPGNQPPQIGQTEQGVLVGFAFGQLEAQTLYDLAALGALRLTPWRMVLVEGLCRMPDLPNVMTTPDDPLRNVIACTGAPGCRQALAETRPLARALAGHLPQDQVLHVSGCAKGCALPRPADVTLTATPDGFDLARNARAGDTPTLRGLSAAQLSEHL